VASVSANARLLLISFEVSLTLMYGDKKPHPLYAEQMQKAPELTGAFLYLAAVSFKNPSG